MLRSLPFLAFFVFLAYVYLTVGDSFTHHTLSILPVAGTLNSGGR